MAANKISRRVKMWLYALGVASLLLFLIKFFGGDIIFVKTGVHPPALDITGTILLIIAFVLFYHDRAIILLDNIQISKVKVSEVEVQLNYLHTELKKTAEEAVDIDGAAANQPSGLYLLLDEKKKEVDNNVKDFFKAKKDELVLPGTPQTKLDGIADDPLKCLCLLCAYDWIPPDFLVTYFTLDKITNQVAANIVIDDVVVIKAIGICMSLLEILKSKNFLPAA